MVHQLFLTLFFVAEFDRGNKVYLCMQQIFAANPNTSNQSFEAGFDLVYEQLCNGTIDIEKFYSTLGAKYDYWTGYFLDTFAWAMTCLKFYNELATENPEVERKMKDINEKIKAAFKDYMSHLGLTQSDVTDCAKIKYPILNNKMLEFMSELRKVHPDIPCGCINCTQFRKERRLDDTLSKIYE